MTVKKKVTWLGLIFSLTPIRKAGVLPSSAVQPAGLNVPGSVRP
jgi:hypothetical protein